MAMSLDKFLLLAGLLFAIGFFGVLLRRNVLVVFMSLELMLSAGALALVAFSRYNGVMDGALLVFFVIAVAAAESAVGLALIAALYRKRQSVRLDEINSLRD